MLNLSRKPYPKYYLQAHYLQAFTLLLNTANLSHGTKKQAPLYYMYDSAQRYKYASEILTIYFCVFTPHICRKKVLYFSLRMGTSYVYVALLLHFLRTILLPGVYGCGQHDANSGRH